MPKHDKKPAEEGNLSPQLQPWAVPVRPLEASLFRLEGFCHAMEELCRHAGPTSATERRAAFEATGIPAPVVCDLLDNRRIGEHGGWLCQAALRACERDMPAYPGSPGEEVRRPLERVRDVMAALHQLHVSRAARREQVRQVLARALGMSALHPRQELLVCSFPYCGRLTGEAIAEVLAFRADAVD